MTSCFHTMKKGGIFDYGIVPPKLYLKQFLLRRIGKERRIYGE